ncbi:Predicted phosphoribosyltransferase [Amycolatopsis arida]|uniref:Predicted phosphoribosyltransferase n=1 Tax=Amycolatopsis arida TaxID=587909 RepID=A0A1I5YEP8_9PSEU|nr:phosphoribosyltransferase family protein [Amycolatopsis arida]TDX90461.1 putative phosphoribosyltransferase [Amycolatopsis arida]SFQ42679.1 Predicted phosphoribosyltransferase [Amycolatopsis arida]
MDRTALRAPIFLDRAEAGRRLARVLREQEWVDPVVLGLPRGGVPVAAVVAEELGAPLDVTVARKIGAPGRPELGVGAVTAEGPPIFDDDSLGLLGLTRADLNRTCAAERAEARRRQELYQRGRAPVPREGRDVIVVDDGLATGVTARAALRALGEDRPRRLVFAAPVCAPRSADRLRDAADDVVCVAEPENFRAVGQWYADFRQTSDDEVIEALGTGEPRS